MEKQVKLSEKVFISVEMWYLDYVKLVGKVEKYLQFTDRERLYIQKLTFFNLLC